MAARSPTASAAAAAVDKARPARRRDGEWAWRTVVVFINAPSVAGSPSAPAPAATLFPRLPGKAARRVVRLRMAHSGVCFVSHDLPENPPESDGGRAGSLTDGCRRGIRTVGRRLERRTQMTDAATSEQPAPDGGDSSIRPQDDLFGYVNGSWYAAAEIPPD